MSKPLTPLGIIRLDQQCLELLLQLTLSIIFLETCDVKACVWGLGLNEWIVSVFPE